MSRLYAQSDHPKTCVDSSSYLLYVLSARQDVSWSAFKGLFDALTLNSGYTAARSEGQVDFEGHFARWQTASTLDALAHVDLVFNKGVGRIYVAPAVLALLPRAGLPQTVLCGARSTDTHAELERACSARGVQLEWEEQPTDALFVPPRVCLQAPILEKLEDVARGLGIQFAAQPPSWELLHLESSLDALLDESPPYAVTELNWRRRDFDKSSLQFREVWSPAESNKVAGNTSTKLVCYIHPRQKTRRHYFIRDGKSFLLEPDWGRYAVLNTSACNVIAYDERSFSFAVPAGAPLPRLLARALALCSGYAPWFLPRKTTTWHSPEQRGFNVYRWIPPQIAAMVAAKLGQELLHREVKINL